MKYIVTGDGPDGPFTELFVDGHWKGTTFWRGTVIELLASAKAVEHAGGRCSSLPEGKCWACLAGERLHDVLTAPPGRGEMTRTAFDREIVDDGGAVTCKYCRRVLDDDDLCTPLPSGAVACEFCGEVVGRGLVPDRGGVLSRT